MGVSGCSRQQVACPGVARSAGFAARLRFAHCIRSATPWQASFSAKLRTKPGRPWRDRTADPLIKSQVLYQLS
jgi:hypothetical protein